MTNAKNERPILLFVLGMHRSGTSALTGALTKLGFRNAEDLMAANEFNASGYWEASRAVEINDDFMESHGSYWFDPWPLDVSGGTTEGDRKAFDEIKTFLTAEFKGSALNIVKDPRICRNFPLWFEAATELEFDVRCLLISRHPAEVVKSLVFRDGMTDNHAYALWSGYMLDAERFSRGVTRASVQYDDLLCDWRGTVLDALNQLSIRMEDVPSETLELIDDFLSADDKHHFANVINVISGQADAEIAMKVYENFRWDDRLESSHAFDQIYEAWLEHRGPESDSSARAHAKSFPVGVLALAEKHLRAGDVSAACEVLDGCDEDHLKHPRLFEIAARIYIVSGQAEVAVNILKSAENAGNAGRVSYYLSLAHFKMDRMDEALAAIDKSLELEPEVPESWRQLGVLQLQLGDLEGAEQSLIKALELDPENAEFSILLVDILSEQGKVSQALQCAQRARHSTEGHSGILVRLGELHLVLGDPEAARQTLETCLETFTDNARAHHALSKALNRTGEPAKALDAARRSVELAPNNAVFRNQFGNLLLVNGRIDMALENQKLALGLAPKKAQFHADLASAQMQAEDYDAAIASMSEAIALAPNSAFFFYRLGNMQKRAGYIDDCSKSYERAIELAPNNEDYRVALAAVGAVN